LEELGKEDWMFLYCIFEERPIRLVYEVRVFAGPSQFAPLSNFPDALFLARRLVPGQRS